MEKTPILSLPGMKGRFRGDLNQKLPYLSGNDIFNISPGLAFQTCGFIGFVSIRKVGKALWNADQQLLRRIFFLMGLNEFCNRMVLQKLGDIPKVLFLTTSKNGLYLHGHQVFYGIHPNAI